MDSSQEERQSVVEYFALSQMERDGASQIGPPYRTL
jgi:hypothetical protein